MWIAVAAAVATFALLAWLAIVGFRGVLNTTYPASAAAPEPVDLQTTVGVDGAWIDERSLRLKELGFRHVLDYTPPHINNADQREYFRAMVSSDGLILAVLVQRLSQVFAHDIMTFSSRLASGRMLATTNSLFPQFDLDRRLIVRACPGWNDFRRMLRVHQRVLDSLTRAGEHATRLDSPEALARHLTMSWEVHSEDLVRRGLVRIQEGRFHVTWRLALAIQWGTYRPLRTGFTLLQHLGWIGLPAAAAVALTPPLPVVACALVLGLVYGRVLWLHASLWSVLIPALLAWHASRDMSSVCWAVTGGAVGMLIGFMWSAGRAAGRGRSATPCAHAAAPAAGPETGPPSRST